MPAAFVIEVQGATEVETHLAGLLKRFGDLEPLMDRLGLVMETQTDERFERGVDPSGQPWKPSIRAQQTGGKTLVDHGLGRQSITHNASRDRVEVGTNLGYMAAHQGGATIRAKDGGLLRFRLPGGLGWRSMRSVTLPRREFLGLSADNAVELEETTEDWLAEALPGLER